MEWLIDESALEVAWPPAFGVHKNALYKSMALPYLTLPQFITDCSSPLTFNKYLKTYLITPSNYSMNQTSDSVKHPCSSLATYDDSL